MSINTKLNIKWKSISKDEAKKTLNNWDGESTVSLEVDYENLRTELIAASNEVFSLLGINKEKKIQRNEYKFDLYFGMKMYELLSIKNDLNVRLASDDGLWRYLSVIVIPDIVLTRWGLNEGRFWRDSRRIWLKTLWWYIYLSWQGSSEETIEVLKNNTTDDVVQLVERSGPSGYRVELSRNIMKYYGQLDEERKGRSKELFRRVMKLNTARTKIIEPSLFHGGEEAYVKELFESFE
jgi:hypothetical protein